MIFKAIVVSRTDDDNQIYVTIPVLDGSNSKTNFKGVNKRLATVCSLPGCTPVYATGDVVYIDFEQDNMSYPIVIGSLLSSESKKSIINLDAESLTVNVNTQLSEDTYIGDNSYENIPTNGSSSNSGGGGSISGIVTVSNGGTGLGGVTQGNYLVGNDASSLEEKTPTEVRVHIGAIGNDELDARLNRDDAVNVANINYGTSMARGISAGDTDLIDGTSLLPSGTIYLYY